MSKDKDNTKEIFDSDLNLDTTDKMLKKQFNASSIIKIDLTDEALFTKEHFDTLVEALEKNKNRSHLAFRIIFNSSNLNKDKMIEKIKDLRKSSLDKELFIGCVLMLEIKWELKDETDIVFDLFEGILEFLHEMAVYH